MRITHPTQYVVLGILLQEAVAAERGQRLASGGSIVQSLGLITELLDQLKLEVSQELYATHLLGLHKRLETLAGQDETAELTEDDAEAIIRGSKHLQSVILAEARTTIIAVPTKKRYSVNQLFREPDSLLGELVSAQLSVLSKIALTDWKAACRCLAFECCTACAFHSLRCVEECVRLLYKAYCPRNNKDRAWGVLTTELEQKKKKPKPDTTLLHHLKQIRINFRNPTDHPEMSYDLEESENLLALSIDVTGRCVKDNRVEDKFNKIVDQAMRDAGER